MKNDKTKSHIFLMLYLMGNGMATGNFINMWSAVRNGECSRDDTMPIMLMTLVVMALSAMRAKHYYDKLYNNKQK